MNDKIVPKTDLPEYIKENLTTYKNFFLLAKDTWYKGKELVNLFELRSTSDLRKLINYLRLQEGLPIISDICCGYKYTENKKDIKKYYDELHYRGLTILSVAKAIKNNI